MKRDLAIPKQVGVCLVGREPPPRTLCLLLAAITVIRVSLFLCLLPVPGTAAPPGREPASLRRTPRGRNGCETELRPPAQRQPDDQGIHPTAAPSKSFWGGRASPAICLLLTSILVRKEVLSEATGGKRKRSRRFRRERLQGGGSLSGWLFQDLPLWLRGIWQGLSRMRPCDL